MISSEWSAILASFAGAAIPVGTLLLRIGGERASQAMTNKSLQDKIDALETLLEDLDKKVDALRDDKIQIAVIERDVKRLESDVAELKRKVSGTIPAVRPRLGSRPTIDIDGGDE